MDYTQIVLRIYSWLSGHGKLLAVLRDHIWYQESNPLSVALDTYTAFSFFSYCFLFFLTPTPPHHTYPQCQEATKPIPPAPASFHLSLIFMPISLFTCLLASCLFIQFHLFVSFCLLSGSGVPLPGKHQMCDPTLSEKQVHGEAKK